MDVHKQWTKFLEISLVQNLVLSGGAFRLDGCPLDEIAMSSPTPAKTQDEAIVVVDKFGVISGGDSKFCPVDKMSLLKEKGVVKELPWNENATTKELSQI